MNGIKNAFNNNFNFGIAALGACAAGLIYDLNKEPSLFSGLGLILSISAIFFALHNKKPKSGASETNPLPLRVSQNQKLVEESNPPAISPIPVPASEEPDLSNPQSPPVSEEQGNSGLSDSTDPTLKDSLTNPNYSKFERGSLKRPPEKEYVNNSASSSSSSSSSSTVSPSFLDPLINSNNRKSQTLDLNLSPAVEIHSPHRSNLEQEIALKQQSDEFDPTIKAPPDYDFFARSPDEIAELNKDSDDSNPFYYPENSSAPLSSEDPFEISIPQQNPVKEIADTPFEINGYDNRDPNSIFNYEEFADESSGIPTEPTNRVYADPLLGKYHSS